MTTIAPPGYITRARVVRIRAHFLNGVAEIMARYADRAAPLAFAERNDPVRIRVILEREMEVSTAELLQLQAAIIERLEAGEEH